MPPASRKHDIRPHRAYPGSHSTRRPPYPAPRRCRPWGGAVVPAALLRARLPGGTTVSWTAEELREAAGAPLARLWNEREGDA